MDLLAVQGTLKTLLNTTVQKHQFFGTQLSLYMITGKTKALTRQTFVGKVMSLLFNKLSRLVITFLLRSKRLLISRLQSPSTVILEPPQKQNLSLFSLFPQESKGRWARSTTQV